MGKRIKDKDPDCKIPVGKEENRCGGCSTPFPRDTVRHAEVSGYDEGITVGICSACQGLFKEEEMTAAIVLPEPEAISVPVEPAIEISAV